MIKYVAFVKKRKDFTREQFKDYWLTKHSQLEKIVLEKTAVKKIVANFTTGMGGPNEPPFDGFVELYFDSIEDMQAMIKSDIPKMMNKDEENFIDTSDLTSTEKPRMRALVEEYVIGEK